MKVRSQLFIWNCKTATLGLFLLFVVRTGIAQGSDDQLATALRTEFSSQAARIFTPVSAAEITTNYTLTLDIPPAVRDQIASKRQALEALELDIRSTQERVTDEEQRLAIKRTDAELAKKRAERAARDMNTAITLGIPTAQKAAEISAATADFEKTSNEARDAERTVYETNAALAKSQADAMSLAGELEQLRLKYVRAGIPMHKSDVLVQLKPTATIGAIRELLDRQHLNVVDVIPEARVLVVRQAPATGVTPAAEPAAIRVLLERLRAEQIVRRAAPDLLLAPQFRPSTVTTSGGHNDDANKIFDYRWEPPTGGTHHDGTAALRTTHLPQAWNFNGPIRRHQPPIRVAVVDEGFIGDHEDQTAKPFPRSPAVQSWHGTHVVGIIGATFDNGKGIDGYAPYASINTMSVPQLHTGVSDTQLRGFSLVRHMLQAINYVLSENPNLPSDKRVRIVNLSYGYNWPPNVNPEQPLQRLEVEDVAGMFYDTAERNSDVIFVSAAGNSSSAARQLHAKWGSPINYIAYEPDPIDGTLPKNIVVVGSVTANGTRSTFSNTHAFITAPGENILSLGDTSTTYKAADGTSQAAPQVAGTLAAMWAYNPAFSSEELLARLGIDRTGSAPPLLDAFEALRRCQPKWYETLADVNDDGRLDAEDIVAFQAELQKVVANPALGNLSRMDLNGSGRLSTASDDVRIIDGVPMSDIDVFIKGWISSGGAPAAVANLKP
jgi:subtilisin family serine protease